jgi:hypothetical protein
MPKPAVVLRLEVVALAAQTDARHVADAHLRAVPVHFQEHVAELLGRAQECRFGDGRLHRLARHGGHAAQLPARDLHVLRLQRVLHVHRHEAVLRELVRIEPDPHGVLRAE